METKRVFDDAAKLACELIALVIQVECLSVMLRNSDRKNPICCMNGTNQEFLEKVKEHFCSINYFEHTRTKNQIV